MLIVGLLVRSLWTSFRSISSSIIKTAQDNSPYACGQFPVLETLYGISHGLKLSVTHSFPNGLDHLVRINITEADNHVIEGWICFVQAEGLKGPPPLWTCSIKSDPFMPHRQGRFINHRSQVVGLERLCDKVKGPFHQCLSCYLDGGISRN